MLDSLSRAFLGAVDHLTRDTYGETNGAAVMEAIAGLGYQREEYILENLARRLKEDGYIDAYFTASGFSNTQLIRLTPLGREEAQEADPIERVENASRRLLDSESFRARYAQAFDLWAAAERLLWEDANETELTTIGHKLREAMQAFATALVKNHEPLDVDPDHAHARARMGAVIQLYRDRLGSARRHALEALGNLWEATDVLVQRQEHGAAKEGAFLTFADARRTVVLTMFLMVEFIETLDDITD